MTSRNADAWTDRRRRRVIRFRLHPAQTVVTGFAGAIVVGTTLLMLPISKVGPGGADFVNALFTATSAVCVTGLTSVDTETYWSGFGQVVIMMLIQVGGLGIMIFASLIGLVLARKLSVRSRLNAAAEAKSVGLDDVRGAVRGIVLISLAIEGIVFAILMPRFVLGYGYSLGEAAWHALFHSISSFNNAGFALYSDNLMRFVEDPFICLPLCAAIILGGLGFLVLMQLRKEFRRPLHWSTASILTCSILMSMHSPVVWAKAVDDQHGLILEQLGVHHVVYPEKDMGRRVAHLVRGAALDFIEIAPGYAMVKAPAPSTIQGRPLGETGLRKSHGVTIAAFHHNGVWANADNATVLGPDDTILVVGRTRDAEGFAQLR